MCLHFLISYTDTSLGLMTFIPLLSHLKSIQVFSLVQRSVVTFVNLKFDSMKRKKIFLIMITVVMVLLKASNSRLSVLSCIWPCLIFLGTLWKRACFCKWRKEISETSTRKCQKWDLNLCFSISTVHVPLYCTLFCLVILCLTLILLWDTLLPHEISVLCTVFVPGCID